MKMNSIQAVKIGTTINLSINGKLKKVSYQSLDEAAIAFGEILKIKENPTDENLVKLLPLIHEKTRMLIVNGFETDVVDGNVYLEGFNTPVPEKLFEIIKEYSDNGYPMTPIVNFWKLLMANPDVRVRESLFDFISTHDFSLTDKGYMITYKAVLTSKTAKKQVVKETSKSKVAKPADSTAFTTFISTSLAKVKAWKKAARNFDVYTKLADDSLVLVDSFKKNLTGDNKFLFNGNLVTLSTQLAQNPIEAVTKPVEVVVEDTTVVSTAVTYTDKHSKTMAIRIGVPVVQTREVCDSDPSVDCSKGLHVGATRYVEQFAGHNDPILVCLVNPMNVVSVPKYDHSKMRVCEYFPFALANFTDKKIEIIEQSYYENDYASHEEAALNTLLASVKASQKPLPTAIGAAIDDRTMAEFIKIIENRLIDLK